MARLLVVEEDARLQAELVQMLKLEGFEATGTEAILDIFAYTRMYEPQLLLYSMTSPNAYDVLLALREQRETVHLPFIALVMQGDHEGRRTAMEMGADDCLEKPFRYRELIAAIHSRLRRFAAYRGDVEETKSMLTHMVAHELRTPLIGIAMARDLMMRQRGQLSAEEQDELLYTISGGINRLSHLVEQIVYLTQIESGALSARTLAEKGQPLQIWQVVTGALDLARRFAHRQPYLDIDIQEKAREQVVVGDLRALKHALAELIANALDFSPADKHIKVSYWQAGDTLMVSIADDGCGMTEEQQQRALFDFEQIDRSAREQQGMGLGLYVSRRIIAAHEGSFQLFSMPQRGTQVVVGLPLAQTA
ncbi:MAG: hybrid sensor histidine kinase/response regulator [Chloroflexi bacterium]|nr:hybrid sensor histidine kinase/response regulator [Chloroflexota bacterium]